MFGVERAKEVVNCCLAVGIGRSRGKGKVVPVKTAKGNKYNGQYKGRLIKKRRVKGGSSICLARVGVCMRNSKSSHEDAERIFSTWKEKRRKGEV